MTKTGVKIENVVIGDNFRVQRTYTGLETGLTISKAWLTVKKSDRELDATALFQKEITEILDTAQGQITDNSTTGGDIAMFFELTSANTGAAKAALAYVYDVQVKTSNGQVHTLEKGVIAFIRGVTDDIT